MNVICWDHGLVLVALVTTDRTTIDPGLAYWIVAGIAVSVAVGAGSILFGAAHLYQGVAGVIATSALGAILAVVHRGTGPLLLPVLLHAMIGMSSMVTASVVPRPTEASNESNE